MAAGDGVAEIEIGDAVGPHRVPVGVGLKRGERHEDGPRSNAKRARNRAAACVHCRVRARNYGFTITPLSGPVGRSLALNRYAHFSRRAPAASATANSDPSYAHAPAYSPCLFTA